MASVGRPWDFGSDSPTKSGRARLQLDSSEAYSQVS